MAEGVGSRILKTLLPEGGSETASERVKQDLFCEKANTCLSLAHYLLKFPLIE